LSIKYYRYDEEIEIVPKEVPENQIRWCKSPLFNSVPGCMEAFYSCEYEDHYGPVKHDPNFRQYKRIKPGTDIICRDMPIELCQKLVDKRNMKCPTCGQRVCLFPIDEPDTTIEAPSNITITTG